MVTSQGLPKLRLKQKPADEHISHSNINQWQYSIQVVKRFVFVPFCDAFGAYPCAASCFDFP